MARPRKVSLSERIKQKRLSSRAPTSQDQVAPAPEVLHVAPLPPLPAIESPVVAASAPPTKTAPTKPAPASTPTKAAPAATPAPTTPAQAKSKPAPTPTPAPEAPSRIAAPQPPPSDDLDDEARLELERSIAPVAFLPGGPRRGIALVAAVAVALGIGIGVKISRARSQRARAAESHQVAVATATAALSPPLPSVAPPPPPPAVSAEPVAGAQPSASASAQPSASASADPAANASAEPAAGADAPSATTLRDHALDLLKRAKNPEAMAAASAALDADPTDAMPYLVLGSALQDTGRWKEAHRTYELCVKLAKKGMLDECRAMLRRR